MPEGISPDDRRETIALSVLALLAALSCAAIAIPFWAPIMWAGVLSLIFQPLYLRIGATMSPAKASLLTVFIILMTLVLPTVLIATMIANELIALPQALRSPELTTFVNRFVDMFDRLPSWLRDPLRREGITSAAKIDDYLLLQIEKNVQAIVTQVFSYGQAVFNTALAILMMLYLCFYFLISGPELVARGGGLLPLHARSRVFLGQRIAAVVRGTVKGSVMVAGLQGMLGGLIFLVLGLPSPFLWGTLMGFAALLPAVGTGLVWVPASVFLLVTGNYLQGILLAGAGVFVISSSDNIVRPMIVGRDTGIPDWAVLVTTLGGVGLFGFHGLVLGPIIAGISIAIWELLGRRQSLNEEALHDDAANV